MPLDPQIAGILEFLNNSGAPSFASGTIEAARGAFEATTVGLRNPATLASVRSTEDREIPGPAGPIPVRIYRPDVDGPVPTMVFLHGGGFAIGSIESHDDQARLICRDVGMVVMSVDYRLAPEHKFPAGFEDCLAATRWAGEHIGELGGDADRLVIGGDSAGGNLSAGVALATRQDGPRLAAQFLIYPGVDFSAETDYPSRVENAEGLFLTAEDMIWFREMYLGSEDDALDPRASMILADLAGAPPAIIGAGEFDPLRDEEIAYAKALSDAGVEVTLHVFDGLIHGFFGLGTLSAGAAAAVTTMTTSLRELLN